MRTVRIDLDRQPPLNIRGEKIVTQIAADVSHFLREYPNGTPEMLYHRPGDATPYPLVCSIDEEHELVTAILTALETEKPGTVHIQVNWRAGDTLKKSPIYRGWVDDDIGGAGDPPAPRPEWVEDVLETGAYVFEALPGAIDTALAEAKASGDFDGEDGVSPTVSVETVEGGHRITIEDAEGTHTFDVQNGEDGADGADGENGFSPTVAVEEITGGHAVTITDSEGAKTFDVMDGTDGQPGADGVSPTITVETIMGGHKITITDAEGTQTVDVMDGQDGDDGRGISNAVLNADYTLTITYTDGTTYTTPSIRGAKGDKGDPGEDAVVDETLTQPGQAADAKVVGDALTSQSTAIAEKQDTLIAGENITIAEDGKTISAASGGTFDHTQLTNRDAADQHPIGAITGLQTTLDEHNQAIDELGLSAILVDSNGRFYVNQEDE